MMSAQVCLREAHLGGDGRCWPAVVTGAEDNEIMFFIADLKEQRHRDEILRPVVMSFIHQHHLIL